MELPTTGTIGRKDIMLARKKMLAELELNDGKGIEINGQELSKNDIIRFFDQLQEPSYLFYHLEIYKDRTLLRFLEHNTLEKTACFADNPLYANEAFIDWIGPYYANSFFIFFDECFGCLMDIEAETLLNNPLLMNGYHRETAWESLGKSIQGDIHRIQFFSQRRLSGENLAEVGRLCDFRRLKMLSQLPTGAFSKVRDDMAFAMMQVCITIFNQINQAWGITNIKNAYQLSVSEGLKENIYNKQREMEAIAAKGNRDFWNINFRQWSLGRKIFVIAVGFLLVIGAISGELDDNHLYKIPPIQQEQRFPPDHSPEDSTGPGKLQQQLKQIKNTRIKKTQTAPK